MRLLHTSDWHLGRTLHGFSLRAEQEQAVRFIVDLAVEREVDCVLIAGDVFDRAIPPVEALQLLNSALIRLDEAGIAAIVTAGNHDSGERLATYSGLLRDSLTIVGSLDTVGRAVEFSDAFGPVMVYPLPYLEPDVARQVLSDGDEPLERSHAAVVAAAVDLIGADLASRGAPRAVIVGHAFVAELGTEAEVSSTSERDLSVGGVQVVPAEAFAGVGVEYVALGHLHRPQPVRASAPAMAYSGSLLRYSLSEAGHDKSVALVEVGAPGSGVSITLVPLPEGRGMARLSGPIDELIGVQAAAHADDFVELVVTDAEYPERMHPRLTAVFPFALSAMHQPLGAPVPATGERGDARGRDPLDVVAQFFRKVTGRALNDGEAIVLRSTYEAVRDGDRT